MSLGRIVVNTTKRKFKPQRKALALTDSAANQLEKLIKKKNNDGFRLGVETKGCSGLAYTLDYNTPDKNKPFDEVVNEKDIKITIDPNALMYVIGTELDFVKGKYRSEFVFNNPNATGSCGCGESFIV
eukprot:TRINITY_DN854_c1_g3_i1.p1 TRINITY_DN854_c1_g3~~TRINITY_DN854_c1_g3_i1.p1  ORF type:complete len:128 (+),score=30.04 TRINITY_DN854_c1_g3_i1:63-446(+)